MLFLFLFRCLHGFILHNDKMTNTCPMPRRTLELRKYNQSKLIHYRLSLTNRFSSVLHRHGRWAISPYDIVRILSRTVTYPGFDRLGLARPDKTIYRLVRKGALHPRKVAGRFALDKAELDLAAANGDQKRGRGRPRKLQTAQRKLRLIQELNIIKYNNPRKSASHKGLQIWAIQDSNL